MTEGHPKSVDSRLAGTKILVVEDESIVSFLLEDMLADLGCEIVGNAAGVREALALIEFRKPDAVVLDVNLRGEMAYPIAERLEAERIPFLFATGYGRAGIPEHWSQRPVLQKPFRIESLAAALDEMLANGRGRPFANEGAEE